MMKRAEVIVYMAERHYILVSIFCGGEILFSVLHVILIFRMEMFKHRSQLDLQTFYLEC